MVSESDAFEKTQRIQHHFGEKLGVNAFKYRDTKWL
jgi:hypothetical protein